jgi:hypothetical protein
MKKLLGVLLFFSTLFGADHDLYNKSLSFTGHYSFNDYDMDIKDSWGWGVKLNSNKSTNDIWEVGAYQLSFDYTSEANYISTPEAKSDIYRFGGNLLWYFDNDSQFTPYALAGIGLEIFGNKENNLDNGLFGTLGGGLEYQLRGDFALMAEGKWFYGGEEEKSMVTSVGVKYSFGQ